jgi:hypothetical protein
MNINLKPTFIMKQKRKFIYLTVMVCFLKISSSCEAEKEFLETSNEGNDLRRELSFKQFKNEIGQPQFSKKLTFSANVNARTMVDFEIDTTLVKSLESNYIVYSMKLDPKFEVSDNKFYNLIVFKDNTDEIVKQIIEFLPQTEISGETEAEIYNYLQNATKELIYSSKMMTTSPICVEVVYNDRCYCVNHLAGECNGCPAGFRPVAQLNIIPCPSYGSEPPPIPTPNIPGNPYPGESGSGGDGGISAEPVLPTTNKDNCNDLKTKSFNQDFKNKMNELKTDASGESEKAYVMFNGDPKYSPKYSGTLQNPSAIQIQMHNRVDCIGFMHCHMNNSNTVNAVNYAVFTLDDFVTFRDLVNNIDASNPTPLEKLTMYVTSDKGTYAIKITDYTKFNDFVEAIIKDYYRFMPYYYNSIKLSDPPQTQINEFLKMLKKENRLDGLELYKCDANYQNWEQLILDANNDTKPIKC